MPNANNTSSVFLLLLTPEKAALVADLAEPFAAEFALLTSLCARGLVLKVNAPANVGVKLRNDYEPVEGEPLTWKLPDLAFASEAWAVLELDIPATDATEGEPVALPITVSVRAATQDSTPLFLMTALSSLPIVGRAAWQSMPADELVARRALELDAGDALEAVRVAMKEAAFSSRSMSSRLSLRDEPTFGAAEAQSVPAFLRRKPEQGKGKRES